MGQLKEWGWGGEKKKRNPVSFLPPLPSSFIFLALVPFFVWPKLKIPIPWSFFAPKPNEDSCYPGYPELKELSLELLVA